MSEEGSVAAGSSGEDAGAEVNWRDGITDPDLKGHPAIADYKTLDGAVKTLIHQGKLVGADKLAIPGKEATPEDWEKVHTALGRPETASGYDFSDAALAPPEGLPTSDRVMLGMIDALHRSGVNQKGLETVLSTYWKLQGEEIMSAGQALQVDADAAEKALQDKWGAAYPAKMDVAQRAFKGAAGDGADALGNELLANGTFLKDLPAFKEAWAEVGAGQSEDSLHGGKQGGALLTLTPAQASTKIGERLRDMEIQKILRDKTHPQHEHEVEQDKQLWAMKVPNEEERPAI